MESHTEAEAKRKWCPFARVLYEVGDGVNVHAAVSVNRFGNRAVGGGALCIASECMLWTWDLTKRAGIVSRPVLTQQQKIDMVRGKGVPDEMKPEVGYCGAAR